MNYNKKTVKDIDVKGKKVLLRCDFNVPQNKETGEITSDKRIVAALPTIQYLLDHEAKVILCSHLGRPKGKVDMKYTLAPVAQRLHQMQPCAGGGAGAGDVAAVLGNLRLHKDDVEHGNGFPFLPVSAREEVNKLSTSRSRPEVVLLYLTKFIKSTRKTCFINNDFAFLTRFSEV